MYRAALDSARKTPSDRVTLGRTLAEMGRFRLAAQEWSGAEADLREALAIRETEMPEAWPTSESRSLLGGALLGQGKATEAGPPLRSGYEGMARRIDAIPAVARPRLAEALDRLIAFGEASGLGDEVDAWKAERARLSASSPDPKKP